MVGLTKLESWDFFYSRIRGGPLLDDCDACMIGDRKIRKIDTQER